MTGEELRRLREDCWRLTQQELAHLLGYHVNRISEWERRAKSVPAHAAKLLEYEKKLRAIKKLLDSS